ncbi:glutamate-1-semialdehyde-2,1-aminomutase [Clostridia bacterium]|nr:glutamate-1-semialdehyde-2,1-aminomutase [Clostridia bacterium]
MAFSTEKSKLLYEGAKDSLLNGLASSLHKGPWQEYPIYLENAKGSRIYDVDGNEYIDYLMGLGPAILGYAPDSVNEAVASQILKGSQIAGPTADLIRLADKLIKIIPSAEKVATFLCSGSEANSFAIRLARAYTGRKKFVKFEGHYHGWLDEVKVSHFADSEAALGPRNNPWRLIHYAGQREPEDVITLPYNDLDVIEKTFKERGNEIAAVIMETVMFNAEPVFPKQGFLEGLRALTTKYGVVLIFDEVITGFRLALGGAQEYFGVTPDISTFAKAIAAGFPVSLVVGKKEIVGSSADSAGTFNGNPLVVAACLATIAELEKEGTYENLAKMTAAIADGVAKLGKKYGIKLMAHQIGSIWTLIFGTDEPLVDYRDHFKKVDKAMYQKMCRLSLENGVRLNPWRGRQYISTAHTMDDIERTLEILEPIFAQLK